MKTIGLLGGMSWESTIEYYRRINHLVGERLGGLRSARIVMHSVDFGPIETLMKNGAWEQIAGILGDAAEGMEKAGADFLLICTNTMHKLAPEIENRLSIPLLHIGDAVGEALRAKGVRKAGLLGTAFTMEQDFYVQRLSDSFGLDIVVPGSRDRALINEIIFSELCRGMMRESSRKEYIRIIDTLAGQGAEAIILGCTEIGLLVRQEDSSLPMLDTTVIHADRAVEVALEDEGIFPAA